MDLYQAFVLGAVQGITEYLPVSSSAHLVLVPEILGWHFAQDQAFIFDVLVQLGTIVGVVGYFIKDILQIATSMVQGLIKKQPFAEYEARLGWFVILSTIPAAIAGFTLKKHFEAYFASPKAVLIFLLVTAGLLVLAELLGKRKKDHLTTPNALWMGFAQVAALFPGISRSGVTISVGVMSGLSKESAARFSFLMSIPILLGASLVTGKDFFTQSDYWDELLWPLVVGTITAAISGYLVIRWFLTFLKTQSLLWFALYCTIVGGGGLILNG